MRHPVHVLCHCKLMDIRVGRHSESLSALLCCKELKPRGEATCLSHRFEVDLFWKLSSSFKKILPNCVMEEVKSSYCVSSLEKQWTTCRQRWWFARNKWHTNSGNSWILQYALLKDICKRYNDYPLHSACTVFG